MKTQKMDISINLDKRRKNGLPVVTHTPKNNASFSGGAPVELTVSVIENGEKRMVIGVEIAVPNRSQPRSVDAW